MRRNYNTAVMSPRHSFRVLSFTVPIPPRSRRSLAPGRREDAKLREARVDIRGINQMDRAQGGRRRRLVSCVALGLGRGTRKAGGSKWGW
jgi:hypothetical protein